MSVLAYKMMLSSEKARNKAALVKTHGDSSEKGTFKETQRAYFTRNFVFLGDGVKFICAGFRAQQMLRPYSDIRGVLLQKYVLLCMCAMCASIPKLSGQRNDGAPKPNVGGLASIPNSNNRTMQNEAKLKLAQYPQPKGTVKESTRKPRLYSKHLVLE